MVLTSDRWGLTGQALERLLERLAPDRDTAALEYEALRCLLVDFFDWRGAPSPESLADETLDRLARKLDDGEKVERLRAYAYGIARRLSLEAERSRARQETAIDHLRHLAPAVDPVVEARARCLEGCLLDLPEESRELVLGYYQGPGDSHLEGRKLLAERLGISYATLKTRAYRIRERLVECLRVCLEAKGFREPLGARGHSKVGKAGE